MSLTKSRRASGFTWCVISALVGIVCLVLAWSKCLEYIQGTRNAGGRFATFLITTALCFVWFASLVLQGGILAAGGFRRFSGSRRAICIALAMISVVAAPAVFHYFKTIPDEAYLLGLRKWANRNVDAQTIRQWHASLPVTPNSASIPASAWPPCVRSLGPDAVECQPAGQGVVLRWGTGRSMDGRILFIGSSANSSPPKDSRGDWKQNAPGVFVGLPPQRP